MKRVSFALTAVPAFAALLLCGCAEAEISYPLSAYPHHPVGAAIAQYLSEHDALLFPARARADPLSPFAVFLLSDQP